MSVEHLARDFARRSDDGDWAGLATLLAPGFRGEHVHAGTVFGRDDWVAFNTDNPVRVRFFLDDLVAAGECAILRSDVCNDDGTFHVVSFLTVAGGLITELVEVWTDQIATPEENQ